MQNNPDEVVNLVLRNTIGQMIGQSLRVQVRRKDLEVIEPGLQRIMRNGLNKTFKFEVKEETRTE